MAQVFSFKLCEIFKNTFFYRTPPRDCFWMSGDSKGNPVPKKLFLLQEFKRPCSSWFCQDFFDKNLCLYKMNSTFFIGDDQMKPNKTLKFYYERRALRNKTLSSSRNLFKQILQSNSQSKIGAYQKVKWKSVWS